MENPLLDNRLYPNSLYFHVYTPMGDEYGKGRWKPVAAFHEKKDAESYAEELRKIGKLTKVVSYDES